MAPKYRVIFVVERVPKNEESGIDLVVKGPEMWLKTDHHAYGWITGYFTKREMFREIRKRMRVIKK